MTTIEIHQKLQEAFGDAVGPLSEPKIDPFAVVKGEAIVDVSRFLRDEPGIELDFCEDLTAVDWPKRNVIEVVYHLQSFPHRHGIVLKVELDRSSPAVRSTGPDRSATEPPVIFNDPKLWSDASTIRPPVTSTQSPPPRPSSSTIAPFYKWGYGINSEGANVCSVRAEGCPPTVSVAGGRCKEQEQGYGDQDEPPEGHGDLLPPVRDTTPGSAEPFRSAGLRSFQCLARERWAISP